MNINLILILIATFGLLLFWLFYRQANSTKKLAQKYLLEKLKDKNLDAEQRKKLEQDLSKILIGDNSNGNSLAIIAVVAVFTIPFSLYFYHQLGNPKAIDYVAPKTQQQAVAAQQAPQMSMQEAIKQLEQRLAQNPNDVDGQMLYARSQISLKNYKKAVTAYRKANELAPNESVILTELAEAIALANNNRSFLGEPEGLLAKAVELKPNNQKALWLLGMTYYEHKDWQKTNAIWSKLYDMIGDAAAKKQLAQQLNDIRTKLGLPAISETEQQDKTENSLVTDKNTNNNDTLLTIKINLTDELKDKIKANTASLYVYAKAASGMPMPIAVVRKPVAEISAGFPLEISMTDSNSLQVSRKLSDFKTIKIGARVSFSGNATPQAGDLQSDELMLNIPSEKVSLLNIDKIRE